MDLRSIPWDTLETAYGTAEDVPGSLERLADASTREAIEILFYLEGVVFHQYTFYTSSPYVIEFLIELTDNPQLTFRARILSLLADLAETITIQLASKSLDENQAYRDILGQCKQSLLKHREHFIALLGDPNPYFQITAIALLTFLSSSTDDDLYKRFLTQLVTVDNPHVQAALLFGISNIAPTSADLLSDFAPYLESNNDLVKYAAIHTVYEVSDSVPERFVPFLIRIITDHKQFRQLRDTPADSEDSAYHPIVSQLARDTASPPDELLDTASFPWDDQTSRFRAIHLLTQVDYQNHPDIKATYLDLRSTDNNSTLPMVSIPILKLCLKQSNQQRFDAKALTSDQYDYLRAIYDNVIIWGDFTTDSPSHQFKMLGLPRNRDGWAKLLKIEHTFPPSTEQAEEVLDRLARRNLDIFDSSHMLTADDYTKVTRLSLTHIGHDVMIRYLNRFTGLKYLEISNSQFTADGIAQFPFFEHLTEIKVTGIVLNESAIRYIASHNTLTSIVVSHTAFKPEWLKYLIQLTNLERILISHNGLTEDDITYLRDHLPDCRVWV